MFLLWFCLSDCLSVNYINTQTLIVIISFNQAPRLVRLAVVVVVVAATITTARKSATDLVS